MLMSEAIILAPALQWSGALRRKLIANASFEQWLANAANHTLNRKTIVQWFYELKGDETNIALPVADVRRVLRQLRERVFFTTMLRDMNQAASMQAVVGAMSVLADLAVTESYKRVEIGRASWRERECQDVENPV